MDIVRAHVPFHRIDSKLVSQKLQKYPKLGIKENFGDATSQ